MYTNNNKLLKVAGEEFIDIAKETHSRCLQVTDYTQLKYSEPHREQNG